jgi:hypothetical protein
MLVFAIVCKNVCNFADNLRNRAEIAGIIVGGAKTERWAWNRNDKIAKFGTVKHTTSADEV